MPVTRRHFFFGSLALPVLSAKTPPAERPNLLLILVDNLPSWVLGSSGNKEFRTPNLDRLAQTGTRFLSHFVCTPTPALSRATLMTGRTPMQLGDSENPSAGDGSLDKIVAGLGYASSSADSGAAGQLLDQQAPGKPFFLTVGCPSLHAPYEGVAQKYRDLYAQTKFDTLNALRAPAANARSGKEMFADLVGNLRKAAGAITSLDDDVGGMLAKLSQRRLLDNTLIILTSTCGALLGRHGLWDSGDASDPVNMYEETVATPLIWSWPGHMPAQGVRPELVSTYDLVPTLCDLLGTQQPARNLCGRSYLLPATGKPLPKKQPWRTTVFGHYQNTDMARVERYKFVTRNQGKGPGELYDMVTDPDEKVNQYENPQFLTIRTPLADHLATWKQKFAT
jgi:arylsulfatase A-like enzyme